MNDPDQDKDRRPVPLQFGIRTMLWITLAAAVLMGTLQWMEVPPRAVGIVVLIVGVAVAAALGLVVTIARTTDDEDR